MLYSLTAVRDNLRNREGKRVFYLGTGDQLTSEAKDFLQRERIEVLPAHMARPERYRLLSGGYLEEKPEHMTHLHGDVLVPKSHPRIAFRGAVDALEAELLLSMLHAPEVKPQLQEILDLTRELIRREVLEEPLEEKPLCGLSQQEIRARSHRPQDFYGKPHFMPSGDDTMAVLQLNRARTVSRQAELCGVRAFVGQEGQIVREDILRALNRISSMLYLLMLQCH
ncbi:MAG: ATP-binding protein [Oscillospiraceae bacterium]|nr:ATP-binding protein [Oscillospiraceae bacterium]